MKLSSTCFTKNLVQNEPFTAKMFAHQLHDSKDYGHLVSPMVGGFQCLFNFASYKQVVNKLYCTGEASKISTQVEGLGSKVGLLNNTRTLDSPRLKLPLRAYVLRRRLHEVVEARLALRVCNFFQCMCTIYRSIKLQTSNIHDNI